jgi:hypothetical protein
VSARSALLALLALLGAWWLAQHALVRYQRAETLAALGAIRAGQSRIGFDFQQTRQLIGEAVEGARRPHCVSAGLALITTSKQANVRLNLAGLALDARRFPIAELRIYSSASARADLIYASAPASPQFALPLALAAGDNRLRVDLEQRRWEIAGSPGAPAPVSWGGFDGRVRELRLLLTAPAGTEFRLEGLYFHSRAAPTRSIEWLAPRAAAARLGSPDRGPIGVRWSPGSSTPEQFLVMRDALRALDPEVVFWPDTLPIPGPAQDGDRLRGWSPSIAFVVTWSLLLLTWRLARWRHRATPFGAGMELTLGWLPLVVAAVALWIPERPTPTLSAALGAQLLFLLTGARCSGLRAAGTRAAWRQAGWYSLPPLLGIALLAVSVGHFEPQGSQRIAAYAGFVLLQQLLLLGHLWPQCRVLAGQAKEPEAVVLAAIVFAYLHAPNFSLMLLAGLGATLWLHVYRRHGTIWPTIASHYALGLAAVSLLPPWLLYSAEVSLRYLVLQ